MTPVGSRERHRRKIQREREKERERERERKTERERERENTPHHTLTIMACVDRSILGHKEHLLEEPQQYDCQYPELEPHQVFVGTGHHYDPGKRIDGVHRRHYSIKLTKRKK